MIIYLVIGNTGESEDYHEWVAKCFIDKNVAEAYLESCQNYTNKAPLDENGETDYYTDEWLDNSPDPFFNIDYTGTHYYILERELITDDFMKQILLTKKD